MLLIIRGVEHVITPSGLLLCEDEDQGWDSVKALAATRLPVLFLPLSGVIY